MPGIDFALLRRQVSLTQVLDLLGFRPTTRRGPQVRGPCLLHGSRSPRDLPGSDELDSGRSSSQKGGEHFDELLLLPEHASEG